MLGDYTGIILVNEEEGQGYSTSKYILEYSSDKCWGRREFYHKRRSQVGGSFTSIQEKSSLKVFPQSSPQRFPLNPSKIDKRKMALPEALPHKL